MLRLAAGAALAWMLAAPAIAAQRPAAGAALRLIDVPYISQSELLCGGAAAAMIIRHAGVRGVYAEDFSALVDRAAGGIATGALQRALLERGFDARDAAGTVAALRRHLEDGVPVVALIEDRPGRFHYVVVIGLDEGAVVYHDPARAPFMASTVERFDRAWSASGRWMLTARPTAAMETGTAASVPRASGARAAERGSEALRAFETADYREAGRLAREAIETDAGDASAWRLLAASSYLSGDPGTALDAWNRAGEPRVDLVRLDGLVRTPHRVAERLVGVRPREVLTRGALARARRRLALLPSAEASSVTYVALPDGLAEVRGAIVEAPLLPSPGEWLFEAARLPIDQEVDIPVTNLARAGDRLTAAWRFRGGHERVRVSFQFPGRQGRGVWTTMAGWQQERYARGGLHAIERRDATLEWTDWISGGLRLGAGAGVSRWDDGSLTESGRGTAVTITGALEFRPRVSDASLAVHGGAARGAVSFAAMAAEARWALPDAGGFRALASATAAHASAGSPPDQWFGAGTGHARAPLLRAHPLLDDGAIRGPVFGRTLAQGSIEAQHDLYTGGLFRIGIAAFVDAAHAWRRADGSRSGVQVDAGVGLRLRLAPGAPAIRIDWARALRDDASAFSIAIQAIQQ